MSHSNSCNATWKLKSTAHQASITAPFVSILTMLPDDQKQVSYQGQIANLLSE
jgi:hypothetical protein